MTNERLKFGRCGLCNINFTSYEEAQLHFSGELHKQNTQDTDKVELITALSLLQNHETVIKELLKAYIYNTIISYSLYVGDIPMSYSNECKRHDIHGEIATRVGLDYSNKVFHIFWELEKYTSLEARKEDDEEYTRRNIERIIKITNEAYTALVDELKKEAGQ